MTEERVAQRRMFTKLSLRTRPETVQPPTLSYTKIERMR